MKRVLEVIQGLAASWGGPGLFVIGFLDSSFLTFPEVNDLLIVWMVTRNKPLILYYALMATAGSVAGCVALYYVARKGGERFLRKRFKESHVDSGMKLFQKYGLLAIVVPALLPPPAPFKIFVLLAGVAAVPLWQFATAVAIARFVRYAGEGLLAIMYGDRAADFMRQHATQVSLWLAGIALAVGLAWILWKRAARRA